MGSSYSHLVFQPPTPPTYGGDLEHLVWLEAASDRSVPALYWQWQGRDGEHAQYTILYSLGNNQDLGHSTSWLKLLSDTLHVDILCYEYTGYGLNNDSERGLKPSEQSCYDDIYVAWSFLTLTKRIPSERIILFGKSLGSGPSLDLAAKIYPPVVRERTGTLRGIGRTVSRKNSLTTHHHQHPHPLLEHQKSLAGVILQSPMTSILNIERDKGNSSGIIDTVTSLITNDMFENFKKVEGITCPVFIIHGTDDEVIPFSHSKKLEGKLQNVWKFLEVQNGHHFDLESETFSDDLLDSLIEFVDFLMSHDSLLPPPKKKVFIPPAHFTSPTDVISAWLKHVGLEQYTQEFIIGGYFDMLTLSGLTDFDLDCIGIVDIKHKELILEAVKELQQAETATQQLQKPPPTKPTLSSLVYPEIQISSSSIKLAKRLSKTCFEDLYIGKWIGKAVSVRSIKVKEDVDVIASKLNTLSMLCHPNILSFCGVCIDSAHVMVLEAYVSEGSLREFLTKNEKLPLKMQVDFATDILVALAYLHTQKPPIFHGCLNSKNVMLHEDGVGWKRAKLGGLGRWAPNYLAWTAPEVYGKRNREDDKLDEKTRNEKIDIYAFGVVCWELATGKVPFASQLAGCAAVRSAANGEYRPSTFAPLCSPSWLRIIEKCWTSSIENRPTLNEIAELLTKIERDHTEDDHGNDKQDDSPPAVFSSYSQSAVIESDDSSERKKSTMVRQRSFFRHPKVTQSKQNKEKQSSLDLEALTLEVSNSTRDDIPHKKERGSTFASFLVPNFAKALVSHGHSGSKQQLAESKQTSTDTLNEKARSGSVSPKGEDENPVQWRFPDRTRSETAASSSALEFKRSKPRSTVLGGSHIGGNKEPKHSDEKETTVWAPSASSGSHIKGHRRTISLASVQRIAHAAHDFVLLPVSPRSPSPSPSSSSPPTSSSLSELTS